MLTNEELVNEIKDTLEYLLVYVENRGLSAYLSIYSSRILINGNFIGLDDRIWLKVTEHKRWFRKTWYSIDQVFARSDNVFYDKDAAIAFATHCITDMHDLIKREDEVKP